jgi:hypothetical protein
MNTVLDRFLGKVNKNSGKFCKQKGTECWEWVGARDLAGYGYFGYDGKCIRAQKAAYLIYVGDFPVGLFALHTCDWPSCVNPDHIFPGTHQDNMADKKIKGRAKGQKKGSGHSLAKLKEEDIHKIFELNKQGQLNTEIAKIFNIDPSNVQLILSRKRWSHISIGDKLYSPISTRRFSDEDIVIIFSDYSCGVGMEKLARKHKTSTFVIHSILRRKNYKDVIIPDECLSLIQNRKVNYEAKSTRSRSTRSS